MTKHLKTHVDLLAGIGAVAWTAAGQTPALEWMAAYADPAVTLPFALLAFGRWMARMKAA